MKKLILAVIIVAAVIVVGSIIHENRNSQNQEVVNKIKINSYPKIASWLAKKDEIIKSGKPYDLVMSGWFESKEAAALRKNNQEVLLLAGLSATWIWDNKEWLDFLGAVANYGKSKPIKITEDMYLFKSNGDKCAFGWESEEWEQEEIYAMDPRNNKWVEYIVSFYRNAANNKDHDGLIVDMVVEKQFWCPEAISDEEWLSATKEIYKKIRANSNNKLIIFNAGKDFSDIDEYSEYFDGYLMENFLGSQMKTTFEDGLKALKGDKIVIFNADTDDTGIKDLNKMRLGLALSLYGDKSFFTYDLGPRDHGQVWWFPEYEVELGDPLGEYYQKNEAYRRDFEKGSVIASPNNDFKVIFKIEHTDITNKNINKEFVIKKGDARIFIK